jgi:non-ribosomal peptide synthetase component F
MLVVYSFIFLKPYSRLSLLPTMPDFSTTSDFYQQFHLAIQSATGIAYQYHDEQYSYPQMYDQMCRLNSTLSRYSNQQIVHHLDKSLSAYSAIFATLLSHNCWIPLSPLQPIARNQQILHAIEPALLLIDDATPEELISYCSSQNIDVINVEDAIKKNSQTVFDNLDFQAEHWAYIMFTSGSTGTPKGVPMTHNNFINFIEQALNILPLEIDKEVFADYHDFCFDISIFYLFCFPLVKGAISPFLTTTDKMLPHDFIQKNNVTVWASVPSAISGIKQVNPDGFTPHCLKLLFLCGEPFSLDNLSYCFDQLKVPYVYNFYGLTETGVENFYHHCQPSDIDTFAEQGQVPIGLPIEGNHVMITKDDELCISGCQVTPGYLGGIGQDRFELIDNICWYHTGDIVKKYHGLYFCKGRMDSQVKIRGYRFELMDVETHINQHPGIDQNVCFVHSKKKQNRLICMFESAENTQDSPNKIKAFLNSRLPSYMIPQQFVAIEKLPINSNGKISRKIASDNFLDAH